MSDWQLREGSVSSEASVVQALARVTGLSALTLRICIQRGLTDAELIQDFLHPKIEKLADPFSIQDMRLAVERFAGAKERKEKIRVYGDYDVDGTTSVALLHWFLKDCSVEFDTRQPDRFKDGYGLGLPAIEQAAEDGIKLLITVDCGITSHAPIARARELGIDVIILDHHQVDPVKGLPGAVAIVDPQRSDCSSGLKQLCGCGLAFYFARAVRSYGRDRQWWVTGLVPNLKQHLDLVVMATAADLVPLTGDNHTLVRHGMDVLKNSNKPGVRALLEGCGLGVSGRDFSPGHLGFVLGPRINAAGRMETGRVEHTGANVAVELLTTPDRLRAERCAQDLERLNSERMDTQNRIWDEVKSRVQTGIESGMYQNAIVVGDASWHEGVVGIVASRVTETFRKPAIVIAIREGKGKGSVRSFGAKDVLQGLRDCSSYLLTFGGHKHAAGVSLAVENLDAFVLAYDAAMAKIEGDPSTLPLMNDGDCALADLSPRSLLELEQLGPFGPGNPEPVFVVRAKAQKMSVLKERHLKFSLGASGSWVDAIWFHGAERSDYRNGDYAEKTVEWAGVPELNRFRGAATPTIRIRGWRKPQEAHEAVINHRSNQSNEKVIE